MKLTNNIELKPSFFDILDLDKFAILEHRHTFHQSIGAQDHPIPNLILNIAS